jgi:O-antigen ligase
VYDFSFIRSKTYLPGSNDGNRYLSIQAGAKVLEEYPLGVGAGDIKSAMSQSYDLNFPQVQAPDRVYPHSEWLVYGCTAGWPGLILFTLIMAAPFFVKPMRERILWIALNATAAFSFLFDIGLEGQYAIFIYCFIVFCWWKWRRETFRH